MRHVTTAVLALLLLCSPPARAQDAHAGHATPYADLVDREIKALSAAEVQGLLAGDGMGLALAAELNGYAGPKHVLELADELGLDADVHAEVERIRDVMLERARRLGERIVAGERALDRAFATSEIDAARLREATVELGRLRGELRAVHLAAHLETVALLTEHQVHRYRQLRGYGAAHDAHE